MVYELKWDNNVFTPLYGEYINIPVSTIIWKDYDMTQLPYSKRLKILTETSAILCGTKELIEEYATINKRKAIPLITTRNLRILDIRFMKELLTRLFEYNSHNSEIKEEDKEIMAAITVKFGLYSVKHQINTLKKYNILLDHDIENIEKDYLEQRKKYDVEFELKPFNISELNNDAFVLGFLSEYFNESYDGYICPNYPGILLFNPMRSGLSVLKELPLNIKDLYISEQISPSIHNNANDNKVNDNQAINTLIIKGYYRDIDYDNIKLRNIYNKGADAAIKWKNKKIKYMRYVPPVPCIPIKFLSPFFKD